MHTRRKLKITGVTAAASATAPVKLLQLFNTTWNLATDPSEDALGDHGTLIIKNSYNDSMPSYFGQRQITALEPTFLKLDGCTFEG